MQRHTDERSISKRSTALACAQFPALLDAVANGELHLTGLLMIGPHLTPENHIEVLGRAKFRTKKELAKLVRELNPLPRVPDLIEPLRPAPLVLPTTRPSWAKFVASWEGPVRELPDGERPGEWANDGHDDSDASPSMLPDAPARFEAGEAQPDGLSPAPHELPPITGPQQYQMQFSTCEEHVQLVERAKALLARSKPGLTLGELHLQAMQLLVASLGKRKFAVTDRPRKRAASRLAPQQTISSSGPDPALDRWRRRAHRTGGAAARARDTAKTCSAAGSGAAPARQIRPGGRTTRGIHARRGALHVHGRTGPALPRDTLPRATSPEALCARRREPRLESDAALHGA